MRLPSWPVLLLALAACGGEPALVPGEGTPADLRELAAATFDEFVEAFPARRGCIGEVGLEGAWELADRASYDPATRTVTVRIPATAPQLETSLVHELGHHLEFSCPEHEEVRGAFLLAQGLDPGTPWRGGEGWEETPSEHWASAVVVHVLGRVDERARIVVAARSTELVAVWADGLMSSAP